jgi:predicted DNA-binding protein YlxM (UPF0122 family)
VKSLIKFILFVGLGTLLAAVLEPLKAAGVPQWIMLLLLFAISMTISQILLVFKTGKPVIFSPTLPPAFLGLKIDLLDKYTTELESIGFQQLADYGVFSQTPNTFIRILVNSDRHCFAIVSQTTSGSMHCMMQSFLTDDWSLANLAYRADSYQSCIAQILGRHHRKLWISQPDLKLARILETHLQRRQQLERDLEIETIQELTVETYLDSARMGMSRFHQNLKRKWIVVGMIQAVWLFFHPKTEWMGEYQARLDLLKNSAF